MIDTVDALQQGALALIILAVIVAIPAMLDKGNRVIQNGLLGASFAMLFIGLVSASSSLVLLAVI